MTSEIDKLKHFHIEDYNGIYFTDELNAGEEFLYTTIGIKDDKEVTFLCKYIKNKHIEACPNCVFNNYFCHGLLCNIVVLKVIKDESKELILKSFGYFSANSRLTPLLKQQDENQKAIDELNQAEYDGKVINVNVAKPRTDRPAGGRGGFNRNGGGRDRRSNGGGRSFEKRF
jgi:hypothetical protein